MESHPPGPIEPGTQSRHAWAWPPVGVNTKRHRLIFVPVKRNVRNHRVNVRDASAKVFAKAGLKTAVIDENHNLSNMTEIVYFSTMHRAKGLEFDQVIVISPSEYLGDPLETDSKRKLIYVALTRAKKDAALILI